MRRSGLAHGAPAGLVLCRWVRRTRTRRLSLREAPSLAAHACLGPRAHSPLTWGARGSPATWGWRGPPGTHLTLMQSKRAQHSASRSALSSPGTAGWKWSSRSRLKCAISPAEANCAAAGSAALALPTPPPPVPPSLRGPLALTQPRSLPVCSRRRAAACAYTWRGVAGGCGLSDRKDARSCVRVRVRLSVQRAAQWGTNFDALRDSVTLFIGLVGWPREGGTKKTDARVVQARAEAIVHLWQGLRDTVEDERGGNRHGGDL